MDKTLEKLIEELRIHHQIQIYTVNENWCVQLFDIDVCANDQVDCNYENGNESLIKVLEDALEWSRENVA